MMGKKERSFAPLINVSLEDLVPADHFYRHLERTLDLSFVREFVQETYAGGGRPSIASLVQKCSPMRQMAKGIGLSRATVFRHPPECPLTVCRTEAGYQ